MGEKRERAAAAGSGRQAEGDALTFGQFNRTPRTLAGTHTRTVDPINVCVCVSENAISTARTFQFCGCIAAREEQEQEQAGGDKRCIAGTGCTQRASARVCMCVCFRFRRAQWPFWLHLFDSTGMGRELRAGGRRRALQVRSSVF